jgi:hypothetical protein
MEAERSDHNENITDEEAMKVAKARNYLAALQRDESGDGLRDFFTVDVRQVEMPNQLNSRGQENDLEQIPFNAASRVGGSSNASNTRLSLRLLREIV